MTILACISDWCPVHYAWFPCRGSHVIYVCILYVCVLYNVHVSFFCVRPLPCHYHAIFFQHQNLVRVFQDFRCTVKTFLPCLEPQALKLLVSFLVKWMMSHVHNFVLCHIICSFLQQTKKFSAVEPPEVNIMIKVWVYIYVQRPVGVSASKH